MPKFTFRLQTVLEHKQRLEELAQLEHARALAAQVAEERSLVQLHDAEGRGFSELERQRFQGKLDIESLQLGMSYLDALKVQITRQAQVVDRVRQASEVKREQLVGAMQERKTFDRLREKQLKDFTHEQARRELVEQDEMVVMRHRRADSRTQGHTYA